MDSTIDQEGMTQQNDMNGLWSGESAYDMEEAPVVFSVWIDDQAGILRGTIIEPNTFVQNALEELDASLSGVRDGQIVDFVKIYSPTWVWQIQILQSCVAYGTLMTRTF